MWERPVGLKETVAIGHGKISILENAQEEEIESDAAAEECLASILLKSGSNRKIDAGGPEKNQGVIGA